MQPSERYLVAIQSATHVTEDHGLTDSQHTVDIGNRAVLVLLCSAIDEVLLDVVE